MPTLQDADDTSASTPVQIGDDDDEDDSEIGKDSKPTTTTHHHSTTEKSSVLPTVMTTSSSPIKAREDSPKTQDADDDDDTDSSRPLVFTPSLETPVETQANTPQDFESMSPAPDVDDDLKREVQVDLVVKGLDEGQAEMEEEMEEVVVKEKEHEHETMDVETISSEKVEDSQMDIDPPLNVDV